jgi:nitrogen fixation NifU-like protein
MSDLRDLYQEVILDHYKKPRNHRSLPAATGKAEGYNPLCGDKVTVYLEEEGGIVKSASFEGTGCAISTASASIMTEAVKGLTQAEVRKLFDKFHELVTGKSPAESSEELGKLAVFSGVREFPVRIKCATLAWHTLRAALEHRQEKVTTE